MVGEARGRTADSRGLRAESLTGEGAGRRRSGSGRFPALGGAGGLHLNSKFRDSQEGILAHLREIELVQARVELLVRELRRVACLGAERVSRIYSRVSSTTSSTYSHGF